MGNLMLRKARLGATTVITAFMVMLLAFLFAPQLHAHQFAWPLEGRVLRGFETPTGSYGSGGHQGIDIQGCAGEIVYASGAGTVSWVGTLPRGKTVSLSHPGEVKTTYLGLDRVFVKTGEAVHSGQRIASLQGDKDPSSAENHLHFGCTINGEPVDPMLLLSPGGPSSYIRLCPVQAENDLAVGRKGQGEEEKGGLIAGVAAGLWRGVTSPVKGAVSFLRDAVKATSELLSTAWNNNHVRAVASGICAAIAIMLTCAAISFTLPVSTAAAATAAVAGGLSAIAFSAYDAATSHSASFVGYLWRSLTVGAVVSTFVVSSFLLSPAYLAAWAKEGIGGTLRILFCGGFCSGLFEGLKEQLFAGKIDAAQVLFAAATGVLAGGLFQFLRCGIPACGPFASGTRAGILSGGRYALTPRLATAGRYLSGSFGRFAAGARGIAVSSGRIAEFTVVSGSSASILEILTKVCRHEAVTVPGVASAFFAGAIVGRLAMGIDGRGIEPLTRPLRSLPRSIRRRVREAAVNGIRKKLQKHIRKRCESLLDKVIPGRSRFGRKEVVPTKR